MALTQKFTTDTADIDKAYNKLERENTKLLEQNRRLAQASKRSGQAASGSLQSGMRAAQGMVRAITGGAGVVWAVGEARRGYSEWIREIQEAGRIHKQFAGTMIKDLSEAGDLARGKELEQFFESQEGLKREDVAAAYAGVSGAAPAMDIERRKAITAATAQLAPTGQDLTQLGELAAQLGEVLTDRTADDLTDLALSLRQQAGRNISRVTSDNFLKSVRILADAGVMTAEQSFATGLQAMEKGLTPEILIKIADTTTRQIATKEAKKGKELTEEEIEYNRFAQAAPTERLAMIREDQGVRQKFMGEMGIKFRQFDTAAIDQATRNLQRAQREDAAQQELAAMRQFPAGIEGIETYRQEVAAEKKKSRKDAENLGAQHERFLKFQQSALEGLSGPERAVYRMQRGLAASTEWLGINQKIEPGPLGTEKDETYWETLAAETLPGGGRWAAQEKAMRKLREGEDLTRTERLFTTTRPGSETAGLDAETFGGLAPQQQAAARQAYLTGECAMSAALAAAPLPPPPPPPVGEIRMERQAGHAAFEAIAEAQGPGARPAPAFEPIRMERQAVSEPQMVGPRNEPAPDQRRVEEKLGGLLDCMEQANRIADRQLDELAAMRRRDDRKPALPRPRPPRGAAQAQLDAQAEP